MPFDNVWKKSMSKPLLLIILDGWGHRDEKDHNAIAQASTPTWDHLWANHPHTLLSADAAHVGLPQGQMGNSEVGHLHMGAGRNIMQDLKRINQSIEKKEFFENKALWETARHVAENGAALHLVGLLSAGGVHSHSDHFKAAIKLAAQAGVKHCFIHAILDGRDTPPQEAISSIKAFESAISDMGCGQIVSLIGRYFAMDRDQRWERTEKAYHLFTKGLASHTAHTATEGIAQAYQRGENDEFIQATRIAPEAEDPNSRPAHFIDGDAAFLMNFRADRLRQLTQALSLKTFTGFKRILPLPALTHCVTLTTYADNLPTQIAYPQAPIRNTFGEYIAACGLHQLRLAETEKYAHVTFFFNGGAEPPFQHETRQLIASPKVATYDLQPEMSAYPLTDALTEAIASQQQDVIICNYANADMVGHSGNFEATLKAVETIDACLARVLASLKKHSGSALITADHGNAELMYNTQNQQPHTAHTEQPVPCIYVDYSDAHFVPTTSQGKLYDIAPTLLHLLNLKQPSEMTGKILFKRTENRSL